ncbi:MAG: DUF4437 domain-containing protein [Phycisphaera sp.]|nr:MAG: DUF4437 domain-containing protein [Phycisphaera sp.]
MPIHARFQITRARTAAAQGVAGLLAAGCATSQPTPTDAAPQDNEVLLASDADWGSLNPARGNQGPGAANLWGDRTGTGATGMLVRFADGFSSPPHIHNVTYRGVVIRGQVHNDDPTAEPMWMPTGSYWTQPAGEVHITAAKGTSNLAYIEIQQGPYMVLPSEQAEDTGERPVNIHESNLVWLDAATLTRIESDEEAGPKIAYLWGDPQDAGPSGAFVMLPAGFNGALQSEGASLRAVVVEGQPRYTPEGIDLQPGSYVGSARGSTHYIALSTARPSVLYVRSEGPFSVTRSR